MYYYNVISFNISLLLLSILIFAKPIVKGSPILCNQTKPWKLGGRDIVADSKGFVLLVVLMPMQCEHCHKQLMKFQTVMETLPEIRIVVIAPYDENPRLIERYRGEFSRVAIGMESLDERIWNTLSGSAHDHFIYDRCGRLASVIRHPKSDTSKFEHTLWALKLAISYAQCGWCQYDPPNLPPAQKSATTNAASMRRGKTRKTRIKAVVYPQIGRTNTVNSYRRYGITSDHDRFSLRINTVAPTHEGHTRISGDQISHLSSVTLPSTTIESNQNTIVTGRESQQQQRVSVHKQMPSPQQTQQMFESGQRRVTTRPDGWTVSRSLPSGIHQDGSQQHEQHQQWRKEQQDRQVQNERKQEQEHQQALEQLRIQQEQQQQQRIREHEEEQRRIQEQRRLQEIQRQHVEQQRLHQQELARRIEEQRKLREKASELYTDISSEEQERHGLDPKTENNLKQLKAGQNQQQQQQNIQDYTVTTRADSDSISQATKSSALYDTGDEESDYDYSQAISKTTAASTERTQILGTKPPEHPTFLFEHQVPCAAFTDKICIEQKRKIGADKMSKCCDKGIYLTDLCVPGRCTNATTELCCMQKFLQSKYKCCLNDSKAINSPGDAFSRCCFHKFVQNDDKCCPAHRAKFHWLTAYEICLPNVRVDLSGLRFTVYPTTNLDTNHDNQALENTITIDLNVDKSWDHSCEQGAKVLQFPYLPNDELEDEKEGNGNSEESR